MKRLLLAVFTSALISQTGCTMNFMEPTSKADTTSAATVVLPPFSSQMMIAPVSPTQGYGMNLSFYAPASFIPDLVVTSDAPSVAVITETFTTRSVGPDGKVIWTATGYFSAVGVGTAHITFALRNVPGQSSSFTLQAVAYPSGALAPVKVRRGTAMPEICIPLFKERQPTCK